MASSQVPLKSLSPASCLLGRGIIRPEFGQNLNGSVDISMIFSRIRGIHSKIRKMEKKYLDTTPGGGG